MKTYFIGGAAIILLLLSCNKRVELGNTLVNEGRDETAEVSLSVDFSDFDRFNLRTYPTDVAEERKHRITFDGLRIVFYSVDQVDHTQPDKVVYAFDKNISATRGLLSGADLDAVKESTEAGFAFSIRGNERIKVGDYIVYVFATLNTELKAATAIGQPFSMLRQPMNYIDGEDFVKNNLVNNHYISEPITISKELFSDNAVNRIYTLPPARLSAINAVVSIQWTPRVQNTEMEIIGDKLQFYPDVQNKKYLLFPEYDESLENTFRLKYPIDANYTGFATKSIDELSDDFFFRSKMSESGRHNSSLSQEVVSNYRAIPENTLAGSESRSNTVTRLIIRVRMIPKSLKERLTPEQLADANLSWVNYLGTYHEAKAFVNLYNQAKAKEVKSEKDQQLIEIADRFLENGKLPSASLEKGYEDSEVQYYHGSYSYYALPITHFTLDQIGGTVNSGGYFGVVRNHHYKIEVKSFAGLGKTSFTYLPNDLDLLSERMADQDQVITDMDVVTNIVEVLY